MRPVAGGRWIVRILIIVPMILVQLVYVVLIVQAVAAQAQLYVRDEYSLTEYWVRSGAAGMLVRAMLELGLFCLFAAALFESRSAAPISRMRGIIGLMAFVGWLCLMLIETLWTHST